MTQHPRFPGSLLAALGDNFEWYIGRDGQQFGPVNSQEMGKLIELGHLKPADLVWRAGFAEWQSAERVFMLSDLARRAAEPPPPPAPPAPQPPAPQPTIQEPAPAPRPTQPAPKPATREPRPAPARTEPQIGAPLPRSEPQKPSPELRLDDVTQAIQAAQRAQQPVAASAPQAQLTVEPRPGDAPARPAADRRAERPDRPAAAAVLPDGRIASADPPPHHRKSARKHPSHDHSRKRRRSRAALAITLVSLVLLAGAATAAYVWQGTLTRVISKLTVASNAPSGGSTAPAPAPVPLIEANTLAAPGAIETSPLWVLLRGEFPEWYAERQREVARLRAEQKDDATVTKYMADQLVALRRNYMDDALGASPEALLKIAETFVANLRQLNRNSVDACFNFISHGEASTAIIPLFGVKPISDALEAQLIAVFEAVAEGRRQRLQHLPPRKEDYDQLVRILGRTGWTNLDLQVFSDPRSLQRAQPVVVCRLVREWFQSQIAIEDGAAQTRLLVESLRPVVGG